MPGVAIAPVALAGVIVAGAATFIVVPSAHADAVGVRTTFIVGSMLVPPRGVISGAIVPGGRDAETVLCTVAGTGTGIGVREGEGKAGAAGGGGSGRFEPAKSVMNDVAGCADSVRYGAVTFPLVDVEYLGDTAEVVGAAETGGIVPLVPTIADMDATGTAGVAGAICPVGVEQVTTVPGVAGSEASGTGASVVSAVPGWVVAENGLGPLSGEVTMAPGVVAMPMDVVPKVETCARQAVQPASMITIVSSKRRIAITPSQQSACALYAR